MTKDDELLIRHWDEVIEQSEALKATLKTKGWQTVLKVLKQIRRESLEEILVAGRKSEEALHIRIGYARAVTYFLNFRETLQQEGEDAVKTKMSRIQMIREAEMQDQEQQEIVHYQGLGSSI